MPVKEGGNRLCQWGDVPHRSPAPSPASPESASGGVQ